MPDLAGWILSLAGVAGALGLLWRTVVKPGAKAIAQREITGPLLDAIADMRPPFIERINSMETRLDALEAANLQAAAEAGAALRPPTTRPPRKRAGG